MPFHIEPGGLLIGKHITFTFCFSINSPGKLKPICGAAAPMSPDWWVWVRMCISKQAFVYTSSNSTGWKMWIEWCCHAAGIAGAAARLQRLDWCWAEGTWHFIRRKNGRARGKQTGRYGEWQRLQSGRSQESWNGKNQLTQAEEQQSGSAPNRLINISNKHFLKNSIAVRWDGCAALTLSHTGGGAVAVHHFRSGAKSSLPRFNLVLIRGHSRNSYWKNNRKKKKTYNHTFLTIRIISSSRLY